MKKSGKKEKNDSGVHLCSTPGGVSQEFDNGNATRRWGNREWCNLTMSTSLSLDGFIRVHGICRYQIKLTPFQTAFHEKFNGHNSILNTILEKIH